MNNNRRDFLKLTGLAGFGIAGSALTVQNVHALPQEALRATDDTPSLTPLNRMPRMVQEYFVDRIRAAELVADKKRAALRSKRDAVNYVREVQDKIQNCFGPWPEKTPLNARVTKTVDRDTYRIENVIFDSRPDFPVTGNLYLPKGRNRPMPAVVGVCGHSDNGKASAPYQSFAQGLARQGYVVLLYDPIGQGERLQYVDSELKPKHGVGVMEHLYAGNQMSLTGDSLSSWFAWDGIRAVDYLLTRPEVDPDHIGVTGNSGGGTQTTWLLGAERRFTMGAPSCFVTTFRHNLENELPADTEQYPPRAIALGLDHTDFIAAMAPKPVILLGQEKDYFDARGLEKSFDRLKKLYKLLGAEENIQLYIGPDYHGYSQLNREAMYGMFNKVTKVSEGSKEPVIVLEKDETLWCTEKGQVGEFKRRNIFSYTKEKSVELKNKRGTLSGDTLKKAVTEGLRLPDYSGVPHFRILRPVSNRNYPKNFFGNYLVETEPGIQINLYRLDDDRLLSRPPVGLKKAVLYVSHLSADEELRQEKFLHEIISSESDSAIFACDVRGIGESRPNTCGDNFFYPYGNDYFYAGHSMMFDYPYAGQKTFDILSILNLLKSYGHDEIHLVGNGRGSIPATFAALLSGSVTRVTLKNALNSYSDMAESEEYDCPFSSIIPDVLKYFDLPDCYKALEGKNISISYQV